MTKGEMQQTRLAIEAYGVERARALGYIMPATTQGPVTTPAARPVVRQGMPSQGYEPCEGEDGFWTDDSRRAPRNQDVYGGDY